MYNNYIICYVRLPEDDIYDVIKELTPVSAHWCSIGLSLWLKRALSESIVKSGGDCILTTTYVMCLCQIVQ